MKLNLTLTVAIDTPMEVSENRCDMDPAKFAKRYQNWKDIQGLLRQSKEKVFWIDPLLNIKNMYEEVIHEL